MELHYWSVFHPFAPKLDSKSCSLKLIHTFVCAPLVALLWMCVFFKPWTWIYSECSCDSSGDYTHLLCDTDGDDRAAGVPRGQCALSSSATWQCLPSCSKEVSLLICVYEVTTLQGQATTGAHNLHSRADIHYPLLYAGMHLEIQIHFNISSLLFFNHSDRLLSWIQRSWAYSTRLKAFTLSLP